MKIFDYQKMIRIMPVLQEFVKIGLVFQNSIKVHKTGQRKICFKISGDDDTMDFIGNYLERANVRIAKNYCTGMMTIFCSKYIDTDNNEEKEELYKYIDSQLI